MAKKSRKIGVMKAVSDYLRENPNSVDNTEQVIAAVGCTKRAYYRAKYQLKKQGFLEEDGWLKHPGRVLVAKKKVVHRKVDEVRIKEAVRQGLVEMEIKMPTDGMILKLRSNNNVMLGTLQMDRCGLKFKKPNSKANCERQLTWKILEKIMEVGLF